MPPGQLSLFPTLSSWKAGAVLFLALSPQCPAQGKCSETLLSGWERDYATSASTAESCT